MTLSKGDFYNSVELGNIYLLQKHKLRTTTEPHLFIVVGKNDEEVVLFSCCTSQFEKRRKHIELAGLPETTLVYIKPDAYNHFDKNTYVDCNQVIPYTVDDLYALRIIGDLGQVGVLRKGKMEEIRTGINDSPNVEGEYKDIVNGNGDE